MPTCMDGGRRAGPEMRATDDREVGQEQTDEDRRGQERRNRGTQGEKRWLIDRASRQLPSSTAEPRGALVLFDGPRAWSFRVGRNSAAA